MDYPNRQRIKIWGNAEFIDNDRELLGRVADADYNARPERVLVFSVKAWSPNCNLHIKQRFTAEETEPMFRQLQRRVAELEEMNASLRKRLGDRPEVAGKRTDKEISPAPVAETPTDGKACGTECE
jgi:hypothetical protein